MALIAETLSFLINYKTVFDAQNPAFWVGTVIKRSNNIITNKNKPLKLSTYGFLLFLLNV